MTIIYCELAARIRREEPVALAVILEANGSAPQGAGAAAIFSGRRLLAGTIGGGSLEADVSRMAAEALRVGEPRIVSYALKGVVLEGREPICGGEVRVLIDPCPRRDEGVLSKMTDSLGRGNRGVLVTSVVEKGKGGVVLSREWIPAESRPSPDKEAAAALAEGRPRFVEARAKGRPRRFLEPFSPPPGS